MDKIGTVDSITPSMKWGTKNGWAKDGFQKLLTDALNTLDQQAVTSSTQNLDSEFNITDHQLGFFNASSFVNSQLSTGMINLYIAQENKNEKTGRGRQIT